ncbi:MAG: protein kinase [Deltaproteobacteria bacterium]|nr:protein kinase [Deltaproteobacteria bacterium]
MSTGSNSSSKCGLCGQPTGTHHVCTNPLSKFLGTQIDERYAVDSVLGKGGMGVVFGGVPTSVHRRVAIKMLHPSLATTPEFFERFRREAELASRLHHPNIVTVFDFGRTRDGGCFYVMELMEGESLRALVRRTGPLPVARALKIIEQVGRALGAAHAAGVIHRDLKPHNVMCTAVDGADFCKVLDFGLVKALEEDEHEVEQLTSTGQVLGTPSYMAPEQAGGEPLDQRADLFALGACLYFCLTGSPPCKSNSAHKVLVMLMNGEVPPVSARRLGAPISASLEAFVGRALAFSPDERPQSAETFIEEMKRAAAEMSPESLEAIPQGAVAESSESGTSSSRLSRAARGEAARSQPAKAGSSAASGPRSKTGLGSGFTSKRRRRRRLRLAVGGGAAVLACGFIGVAAKALLSTSPTAMVLAPPAALVATPAPVPVAASAEMAPARPPRSVAVRAETIPPGAQIYRGAELLGVTPADLLLGREIVNLTFKREGFQAVTKGVDLAQVPDGEPFRIKLELASVPVSRPAEPRAGPKPGKKPAGPDIPTFDD